MDAIDILGGLLGGKASSGRGGIGTKILKDILGGALGSGRSAPQPPQPQPPTSRPAPRPSSGPQRGNFSPTDLDAEARELEELLNVANGRRSTPKTTSPDYTPASQPIPSLPKESNSSSAYQPKPGQFPSAQPGHPKDQNEHAVVLIRAMIHASKADGDISEEEQRNILQQIGDGSPETMHFLRQEFGRPVDVREFAWSVPLGLESQVYTMSLLGMKLDSRAEADYLAELAQGLRLAPQVCNQIHSRYGAPEIFKN
jgi:Protein of unknown function (DUF533)